MNETAGPRSLHNSLHGSSNSQPTFPPRSLLRDRSPYFCAGGVKRHLNSLGFPKVYNENEDFYKVITTGRVPP